MCHATSVLGIWNLTDVCLMWVQPQQPHPGYSVKFEEEDINIFECILLKKRLWGIKEHVSFSPLTPPYLVPVINSKLVSLDCVLFSNWCLICIIWCREHMQEHREHLEKLKGRELYALGP